MSKQHIVIVYEDAAGALHVIPDQLKVKHPDTVMFFSEDLDIEVDFTTGDCPFDNIQFDVPAANYMTPEPVTEKPPQQEMHHYTIFALSVKRQILQQIDPVIIVDPYPLMDMVKTARSKPTSQK